MNIADLLGEIIGAAHVLTTTSDMDPYLVDERELYHGEAACIAFPANTEEVALVVRTCVEAGYAIVPQGGNTGYCSGASPDSEKQVLLNLSRMNTIREIDPVGCTATVDAGVVLATLHEAVEERNLFFPLSMGSQGSCQVGGILSTNAGGLAVLKYGTAAEQVLGLEVVLPNGDILNCLTPLRKDNTGYNLNALFLGAEGSLGIITAAVLRLFPRPTEHQTAWLAAPNIEAVCQLLVLARAESADTVTSFEYISLSALNFAANHIEGLQIPFDENYEHQVLIELSGPLPTGALRERLESLLTSALEERWLLDAVLADSQQQRQQLWRIREGIPEAEKHAGRSIKHDISVAIGHIPEFLRQAPTLLESVTSHRPSVYGHMGDGNLHYNVLAPADVDPIQFRAQHAKAISEALHGLAMHMKGSFSAEHGIGKLKKQDLARYTDSTALQLMRTLKQALDPKNVMNPGKVL